jgi:hypothetical protein
MVTLIKLGADKYLDSKIILIPCEDAIVICSAVKNLLRYLVFVKQSMSQCNYIENITV